MKAPKLFLAVLPGWFWRCFNSRLVPQVLPLFSKGTGWTTCCVAGFGECRVLGVACGM